MTDEKREKLAEKLDAAYDAMIKTSVAYDMATLAHGRAFRALKEYDRQKEPTQ
jgi:hypothetical protein